ncbi:hypothetical protein SAMN04515674_1093 [Pseudarcicella hirudinis]|uniref:Uncharacterized protein n=1 Tax=Pseudarcicella hirudinis TaxID=1079859 RepID=A0A1I5VA34_9BACT|nr:hypothetical protein [Pseudarcicella hirudinis]SFQ04272.1 hypothetical protein SAMN04515674_1093 [Pseudarcicella hirudinis]
MKNLQFNKPDNSEAKADDKFNAGAYRLERKAGRFLRFMRRGVIHEENTGKRIFYIGFIWLFSSFILFKYTHGINLYFGWEDHFLRELVICLGQIVWQTLFLHRLLKHKTMDYLNNMMTVSLIGTILLIPPLFFTFSPFLHLIYFIVVVSYMFLEHFKRCSVLQIGWLPSITWVMYRFFGLGMMMILQ